MDVNWVPAHKSLQLHWTTGKPLCSLQSLQKPQPHVKLEVVRDYVTARHFVQITMLLFPNLCVCIFVWVCLCVRENRTVSALTVSSGGWEGWQLVSSLVRLYCCCREILFHSTLHHRENQHYTLHTSSRNSDRQNNMKSNTQQRQAKQHENKTRSSFRELHGWQEVSASTDRAQHRQLWWHCSAQEEGMTPKVS